MKQDAPVWQTWKVRLLAILVVLLCLGQVVTLFQLNEANSMLTNLKMAVDNQGREMQNQVRNIEGSLLSVAEKEASMLSDFSEQIGEPDLNALTIPANIALTLKEVDNNTAVSIQLGEQTFALQRDGVRFTASIPLPLFSEASPTYTILAQSGGATKIELRTSQYYLESHFPMLRARISGTTSAATKDGTFQFNQDIMLEVSQISAQFDNLRMVCTVEDVVVYDQPIDTAQHDNGGTLNGLRFPFEASIQVPANQTLVRKIIATDAYGLVHQRILDIETNVDGTLSDMSNLVYLENDLLFRPDGTLLYKPYDLPVQYAKFH